MATVSSSSPYHQHGGYGSPFSLGLLLEQHHNQCVPASPSLSPLFGHGPARSLAQRLASTSHRGATSPAAAQVPELSQQQQGENSVHSAGNGSRIYSGSPLLMQILKVSRKRQHESGGTSPLTVSSGRAGSPSPVEQGTAGRSKRARVESPASRVPSSIIIVERKHSCYKTRGLEQVVPTNISPLESCRGQRSCKVDRVNEDVSGCQRRLPVIKDGVKPLNLFSGDEIFANHNEE